MIDFRTTLWLTCLAWWLTKGRGCSTPMLPNLAASVVAAQGGHVPLAAPVTAGLGVAPVNGPTHICQHSLSFSKHFMRWIGCNDSQKLCSFHHRIHIYSCFDCFTAHTRHSNTLFPSSAPSVACLDANSNSAVQNVANQMYDPSCCCCRLFSHVGRGVDMY